MATFVQNLNKDKFTREGLEPPTCTSGLNVDAIQIEL